MDEAMSALDIFDDFDDLKVYEEVLRRVVDQKTQNFVVEFGKDDSKVAFDLGPDHVKEIFKQDIGEREAKYPVRWM